MLQAATAAATAISSCMANEPSMDCITSQLSALHQSRDLEDYVSLFLFGLFLAIATVITIFIVSEFALMIRKRHSVSRGGPKNSGYVNIDKAKYSEMVQYRLDHYFSTSKWAKPALLLSFTFVLIVIGALSLAAVAPESSPDSLNVAWVAWTYVADPGTHAEAEGTLVRLVSFSITIGGMVIFAILIGFISEFISERVDDLKHGKSRVIECDHTLMLGWSDKSLAIIEQICLANESEGGGAIVVLAADDKQEMESKLMHATESSTEENHIDLLGTEVIFRSGNPLLEHELRRVSVGTARAIVVLSPPDVDPDEADSLIVRQVLALKAVLGGRGPHLVVEMQDIDNKTLVELVDSDQKKVEVVVAHDIIGRLMIQCAREPGLAHVLESLLGFEGDEFYFEEWPELHGKMFFDITCRFDDAVPVGVKRGKDVVMCPPNDYRIESGDKILCLAEDNDTYKVNDGSYSLSRGKVASLAKGRRKEEKLLFCGWRRDMADMISLLDELVVPGSELWLFNQVPVQERANLLKDKDNKEEVATKNLIIKNAIGSPIVRRNLRVLAALDNKGLPTGRVITLDEFDSILILSDSEAPDTVSSDSRSLASLLLIQDLQSKIFAHKMKTNGDDFANGHDPGTTTRQVTLTQVDEANQHPAAAESCRKAPCDPIGEILDTRTRSLLQVAGCKGYVMSNHIVSMMLASVAEDRDMNVVLGELLSAHGSETKLRDVSYYLDVKNGGSGDGAGGGEERSFWDVAILARQRREVAIGYKPRDMSWADAHDLILNPPNKSTPRTWEEGDIILVFGESDDVMNTTRVSWYLG